MPLNDTDGWLRIETQAMAVQLLRSVREEIRQQLEFLSSPHLPSVEARTGKRLAVPEQLALGPG